MSRVPDFSTQPRRQGPGTAELLLVGAAGAAVLASALSALGNWSEMHKARAALERTRAELASTRAQSLAPRGSAEGDRLASRVLLSREAPPQLMMGELAALLPAEVRLDDVSLAYDDRLTLELRVRARDAAAYDQFLARLAASPRFAAVVPGEETRGSELVASVRLAYRERGGS
jgi:hypothetical protein